MEVQEVKKEVEVKEEVKKRVEEEKEEEKDNEDPWLYLSLLNLRECRMAGIFCLRFHRWMLSSAKALTSAPWKTDRIAATQHLMVPPIIKGSIQTPQHSTGQTIVS